LWDIILAAWDATHEQAECWKRWCCPRLRAEAIPIKPKSTSASVRGGGTHKIDAVAEKAGQKILVSLKWQQVGGTAEQKVPFEVICLKEEVVSGNFAAAYLVLGGDGWTLRDYFVSTELAKHIVDANRVNVVTLERFVAIANSGKL
jgi:hypothetical protein